MASLTKIGKVWYVQYYNAEGRKRKVKGYSDKAETQRLAIRLEDEKTRHQRGEIDPQAEARKVERARPVTAHIETYKAHLQAKGASKNHVAYTIGDIQKLVDFGEVKYATGIVWNLVDKWVLSLKSGDDADSPRTINRRVGSVQSFLRHLHRTGGVTEYVLVKYPKQQTRGKEVRKRRALSKEESKALLACASVPEDRRFLYRFTLLTGLRYAEVGSMTTGSFNFDQKTLKVSAADAKNKRRDQIIPLHPDLIAPVKKLCVGKGREEKIFELPCRADAAKLVRADCAAAKIDTTHLDFHALRHTYITHLAESNIHPKILQTLARHSSLETTLRYYVHFRQADEHTAISGLSL